MLVSALAVGYLYALARFCRRGVRAEVRTALIIILSLVVILLGELLYSYTSLSSNKHNNDKNNKNNNFAYEAVVALVAPDPCHSGSPNTIVVSCINIHYSIYIYIYILCCISKAASIL